MSNWPVNTSSPYHTIECGMRVKFVEDNRQYVGVVLGVVPAEKFATLGNACSIQFSDLEQEHQICMPLNGNTMVASNILTYLVSVKAHKYSARPRDLHRVRQVKLCGPDDKRDGVYQV